MKKNINNIDRFETFKNIDSILYGDSSSSYSRRYESRSYELSRRKYTGLDSYVGTSDYGHDIWC